MAKKKKRGSDGYGSWNKFDDFETEMSFSWLVLTLVALAIGIFIVIPRVPPLGIVWVIANVIYLFKKIREVLFQKKLERDEVVEEEKVPYHVQVAREQERREAEAKAAEQAQWVEQKLKQLEEQKESGLISRREYESRRQDLLSRQ